MKREAEESEKCCFHNAGIVFGAVLYGRVFWFFFVFDRVDDVPVMRCYARDVRSRIK